ncbi:MAG: hypothetical protein L0Y54_07215 [Sporichthyaceae bacterium]|nr:hypothetical protein [Sporichthyaceae bacterium]
MLWRDRKVLLALGATAAMGVLFGMLLAVLTGGGGGSPQTGPAANTTTASPTESEPDETSEPPTAPPSDLRNPDYGFITAVESTDGLPVLSFDRVDFFTGEEARQRWEDQGGEPLDYFISNVNKRLRERVVSADVTVIGSQRLTGDPAEQEIDQQQLYDYINSGEGDDMLITLRYDPQSGEVTEIKEIYLP